MKKHTRQRIAGLLAAMTIFSAVFEPMVSYAMENAPAGGMATNQTISGGDAAELTVSGGDAAKLTVSGGDATELTVSGGDAAELTVSGGDAAEPEEEQVDAYTYLSNMFFYLKPYGNNKMRTANLNAGISTASVSTANLVKGAKISYPSDLGGNYSTHYYTLNNNIAYCMEPDNGTPSEGEYEVQYKDDPNAIRALIYGYGGPFQSTLEEWMAQNGVTADWQTMYVYTHIAIAYYYTTNYEKAFKGVSGWQSSKAYAWIQYLYDNTALPLTVSTNVGNASVSKSHIYAGYIGNGYLQTDNINTYGTIWTDWSGARWTLMYLGKYNTTWGWSEKGASITRYGYSDEFNINLSKLYALGEMNKTGSTTYQAFIDGQLRTAAVYRTYGLGNNKLWLCLHEEHEYDSSRDIQVAKLDDDSGNWSYSQTGQDIINKLLVSGTNHYSVIMDVEGTGYTMEYINTGGATQDIGTYATVNFTGSGSSTGFDLTYLSGAYVQIKKISEDGKALSGTKFGIYTDAACTMPLKVLKYSKTTDSYYLDGIGEDGVVTTGPDGIADLGCVSYVDSIDSISGLANGIDMLYVKEVDAPAGYKLDETVHEINLADGQYHPASNPLVITVTNERNTYHATITKYDMQTGSKTLKGAIYEVYADDACTNKLGEFEATGSDGTAALEISAEYPVVWLKELQAPDGYATGKIFKWNLTADTSIAVYDSEQFGKITIRKIGSALNTASLSDSRTTFEYTDQGLEGAHFMITAGSDIYDLNGNKKYSAGDTVVADLVTDASGTATVDGLYIGLAGATYIVTETQSPAGYTISEGPKTVTLNYNNRTETVEGTVSFTNKRLTTSVSVTKKDEKTGTALAGAVIGLYAAADIRNNSGIVVVRKDTLLESIATGDDGNAKFTSSFPVYGSYYVREIQAPDGYRLNARKYDVVPMNGNTVVPAIKVDVTNLEQFGEITVYKEGEVLTDWSGSNFTYETRRLPGFTFQLTAGADIYRADGSKAYCKGDTVVTEFVTGADGSYQITTDDNGEKLHLGTYTITETGTIDGYTINHTKYTVNLTYAGQDAEVVADSLTVTDKRQTAGIEIIKKDQNDNRSLLKGGEYTLYTDENIYSYDGTLIVGSGTALETITTGRDGKAAYTVDLPINYKYHIEETKAPYGYLRNSQDTYEFRFDFMDNTTATAKFSHTFENVRVSAAIRLQKLDAETNSAIPQGDATLTGAVYGIYAREDIVHPDGVSGVIFHANDLVTTITTDENGYGEATDLYLGKYFCKEITASDGYLPDKNEYDLDCAYEGDLTAIVVSSLTSKEQVKKQPFQLIKVSESSDTEASVVPEAGFSAYLKSNLTLLEDGSYDFSNAAPVILTDAGSTILYTDKNGYAKSIALPYGTYVVKEVAVPANLKEIRPFEVRITEHHPDTPQEWRIFLDREFTAKLRIIKKDSATGMTVLKPDAEFKIFDLDKGEYVTQYTTYPSKSAHTSFFTNQDGDLILPEELNIGSYRIEEISAPDGYMINTNYIEITVEANAAYIIDPDTNDVIITVVYEDAPVTGELTVLKRGEVLTGYALDVTKAEDGSETEGSFVYEIQGLAGAGFTVYAAENIYTADNQKDENGERRIIYAKGEYIGEIITGTDGTGTMSGLPLGMYKVVETKAPYGYVLSEETQNVKFAYADQNTPVVFEELTFANARQQADMSVIKKDAETDRPVSGAIFGLYAAEDIINAEGVVIVNAGQLLETAVSDKEGKVDFKVNVPFGLYEAREIKAPIGYVSTDNAVLFDTAYQGQDIDAAIYSADVFNQPTRVEISKTDITTGQELPGARLTILDKEGNEIETWVSEDKPHYIEKLPIGTYILHEVTTPDGYLTAEDVTFIISDTAELQKVVMQDSRKPVIAKAPSLRGKIILIIEENTPLWNLVNGRTSPELLGAARFRWNNARTEDDGTTGFSILAAYRHPVFPFLLSGILLIIISIIKLTKTKKKHQEESL